MSSFARSVWRCYWIISFHTRLGRVLAGKWVLERSSIAGHFRTWPKFSFKVSFWTLIQSFWHQNANYARQLRPSPAPFEGDCNNKVASPCSLARFVCCFTAGKTRYRNFHSHHVENMSWPWHRFSFHRVFFRRWRCLCFAREWERNFLIFDPLLLNSSEYHLHYVQFSMLSYRFSPNRRPKHASQ